MKTQTKPIRELMPEGFTRLIMSELGEGSASTISEVVTAEKTKSKYWPAIERLAKQTDPKAYERRMEFLNKKKATLRAA